MYFGVYDQHAGVYKVRVLLQDCDSAPPCVDPEMVLQFGG